MYDLEIQEFFICLDVIFYENIFPSKKITKVKNVKFYQVMFLI